MGSQPGFSWDTVWFQPCLTNETPEEYPPLRFDSSTRWWKDSEANLRLSAELAKNQYLVGCPDLVENIDILAALRDPQTLLVDLVERPDWVEQKVWEINAAWYEAYQRVYEINCQPDGSSIFGAFQLWSEGRMAKVQCDTSAMFSPSMFKRFVVPALTEQCRWLDHSMYHLDGHQCICHLNALLAIKELDAIEWTPDPQVPNGGDPCWYEMYRKIIASGKSIQAVDVHPEQVQPLLDAVGPRGVYLMVRLENQDEVDRVQKVIEPFRSQC